MHTDTVLQSIFTMVNIDLILLFDLKEEFSNVHQSRKCQKSIKKEKPNKFSRSVIASFLRYILLMKIMRTNIRMRMRLT